MTFAKTSKSLNFEPLLTHPPLPLYLQTSNFGLSTPHSWTFLTGIHTTPPTPPALVLTPSRVISKLSAKTLTIKLT